MPLTGVRFLLALWVVVFHECGASGYLGAIIPELPGPIACVFRTGYVAVSLFFVLSGFVLAYNYSLESPWAQSDLRRFAVARFARIYPVYCMALIFVLPIVLHRLVKHFSPGRLANELVQAGLSWTLLQSWIPQMALAWNSPGWSLSAEAFFYACFPVVGVWLWRFTRVPSLLLGAFAIWVFALAPSVFSVILPIQGFGDASATSSIPSANEFWANLVKFNPLLRIPDFAIGILTARAYQSLRESSQLLFGRGWHLYIPALALELWVLSKADSLPYPLVHNGLLLPLHALLLLGLALGGGPLGAWLSTRPMVFFGKASYSMYLLHAPIAVWLGPVMAESLGIRIHGLLGMIIYLGLVIGLASLSFKLLEEPANRILKQRLSGSVEAFPIRAPAPHIAVETQPGARSVPPQTPNVRSPPFREY